MIIGCLQTDLQSIIINTYSHVPLIKNDHIKVYSPRRLRVLLVFHGAA